MLIRSTSELSFTLSDLAELPAPTRVVMTSPVHFDVSYVINAHMAGNIGTVDRKQAISDWERLRDIYCDIGFPVDEVPGIEGLPDMVFCANQTLPFISSDGSERGVVLSKMFARERKQEVAAFSSHFASRGYSVVDDIARGANEFEGMGDALWHSGKRLLWGGYGFRTDATVYEFLSEKLDVPVILLRLEDPEFYHLDTCMCLLGPGTVLIYAPAFKVEGLQIIRDLFDDVIEAPGHEARRLFACNAHSPDGRNVIIQRGCDATNAALRERGFTVHEIGTEEYLKSGGSVFCMKLMTW